MLLELVWIWTGLAVAFEIITLRHSFSFKRKVLEASAKYKDSYTPLASVIVPFRGIDQGLEHNISAILRQDYQKREYIFVIDGYSDPAYKVLKKFRGKFVRIVLSKKIKTCSGKLAALIAGAGKARGKVLVFADSDIRPQRTWLREIVKPLQDSHVGAVTGYRWYFPSDSRLASYLRSAWSSIGFGMMFSKYAFVWGGSFALTRDKFREMGIANRWVHGISDDTEVTKACRKAGYRIHFAPSAVVGTFENSTWSDLKEFSNRQTYFVRNYDKKAWKGGIITFSLLNFMLLTGFLFIAFSFWRPHLLLPGVIILLLQLLALVRSYLKQKVLEGVLPSYTIYFKEGRWRSMLSEVFVRPLANYNLVRAKFLKEIEWRGRRYSI